VPKVGERYVENAKPATGRKQFVYEVVGVLPPSSADPRRRVRLLNTDRLAPLEVREVGTKEFGLSRMRKGARSRDWELLDREKRR
jgi:hypothetical protein